MLGVEPDLLLLARSGIVVQRFNQMATNVEIRIDSRRLERRHAAMSTSSEERRRQDRRVLDVTPQLNAVGWVFIAAAQRRVTAPVPDVAPARPKSVVPEVREHTDDESAIARRLAGALLCAPCLAGMSTIPIIRVEGVLETLQSTGKLRMLGTRCESCRKTTLVYALDRL